MILSTSRLKSSANVFKIYATFASDEEKLLLSGHGGIPEHHLIDVRSATFACDLKSIGDAQGFDVVLAARGSESARECWGYLRRGGRLITVGQSDLGAFSTFDPFVFSKGATLSHFSMDNYSKTQPEYSEWALSSSYCSMTYCMLTTHFLASHVPLLISIERGSSNLCLTRFLTFPNSRTPCRKLILVGFMAKRFLVAAHVALYR